VFIPLPRAAQEYSSNWFGWGRVNILPKRCVARNDKVAEYLETYEILIRLLRYVTVTIQHRGPEIPASLMSRSSTTMHSAFSRKLNVLDFAAYIPVFGRCTLVCHSAHSLIWLNTPHNCRRQKSAYRPNTKKPRCCKGFRYTCQASSVFRHCVC
jgi:hypothetical protein